MITNLCILSIVQHVKIADCWEIWGNVNTLYFLFLIFSPQPKTETTKNSNLR